MDAANAPRDFVEALAGDKLVSLEFEDGHVAFASRINPDIALRLPRGSEITVNVTKEFGQDFGIEDGERRATFYRADTEPDNAFSGRLFFHEAQKDISLASFPPGISIVIKEPRPEDEFTSA